MNHSPWIAQLNRTRPVDILDQDLETDVVVIGGGIAGVTTAFYLLTKTDKHVVLIEADKVAHGATGHNAGQITSYFEKTLTELVAQFGFDNAIAGQRAIEQDARKLLEDIWSHAMLQTPRSEFIGYEGLTTLNQILAVLDDLLLRSKSDLVVRKILIAQEWLESNTISDQYVGLYTPVRHKDILGLLETGVSEYIAAYPFLSGCTNSALFTEELVGFLIQTYPTRFVLKEHTPIQRLILNQGRVVAHSATHSVSGTCVVLCTNGFENISIVNNSGPEIDGRFHAEVGGKVGYMAAYRDRLDRPPFASIYTPATAHENNPYFYVTRRPHEDSQSATHNIICIGGPEYFIPDRATYDSSHEFPMEVRDALDTFTLQTYKYKNEMDFRWHGLMGYTKSGVRLVGYEPRNRSLLYNLGCNGVGILTSVYGAERIARLILGETLEPTIFDPQ
jgi:glycine/D-amino acid oxidase-like deaminating enzyme